jgi:hypothetical protein
MANVPAWYIDNNKTIYYSDQDYFSNLAAGTFKLTAGLSDITDLPGQSTWIVNKIKMGVHFNVDVDVSFAGACYGSTLAGIMPRGNTTIFNVLNDYLDVKGWPLKGSFRSWHYMNMDSGLPAPSTLLALNRRDITITYSPRKTLVLNREQDINWSLNNDSSVDVSGKTWIYIEARRGE